MLRTAGKFWVASMAGALAAMAFWSLVDPFAPKALDGLIAGAVFAIGWILGYLVIGAAKPLRRLSAQHD